MLTLISLLNFFIQTILKMVRINEPIISKIINDLNGNILYTRQNKKNILAQISNKFLLCRDVIIPYRY